MRKLPNIHPGEALLQEFLIPLGIRQNALARSIGVPPRRINEIVLGKRALTADTAVRLAHYFGTSEQFWMALQPSFDLEEARKSLGPGPSSSIARLHSYRSVRAWRPRGAGAAIRKRGVSAWLLQVSSYGFSGSVAGPWITSPSHVNIEP